MSLLDGRPATLDALDALRERAAPVAPRDVVEVMRAVAASPDLAGLANPWRPDGWPAGWHAGLEHLLGLVEVDEADEASSLTALLDELPELLQGTLAAALLRHGLADVEGVGRWRVALVADHAVRQIEFDSDGELKRSFDWALDVLREHWPEAWGPALAEAAAAAEGICYDVWPPIRDFIAPHASPSQLVRIAAHHSNIQVEEGAPLFGVREAITLALRAGEEGLEAADAVAAAIDPMGGVMLSELLLATIVRARMYAAAGRALMDADLTLWNTAAQHVEPALFDELVAPALEALPLAQLVDVIPLGSVRELEHPGSGDLLTYRVDAGRVEVETRHAASSNFGVEIFAVEDAQAASAFIDQHARQRVHEGWVLPGQRVLTAPSMTPLREHVLDMAWRPGHDELLLATGEGLARLSGELDVLDEIALPGARQLAFSPDGRWLAVSTGEALWLCDAATGEVRWVRELSSWRLALAWFEEQGLLAALASQRELLTLDLATGEVVARTARLNSVEDDICALDQGRLLCVNGGSRGVILDARTHEVIARGPRVGSTMCRAWVGQAVWAESCDAVFWQDVSGGVFAPRRGQLRLSERVPADSEPRQLLYYQLLGGSPDGRAMILGGADNWGEHPSVAIVDLELGRHVLVARCGESGYLRGAVLAPGRRRLLVRSDEGLFSLDLAAQGFEDVVGSCLLRADAPARDMLPGEEGPYEGRVSSELGRGERASVRAWLEQDLDLAAPASWREVSGDVTPAPSHDEGAPDDPLLGCDSLGAFARLILASEDEAHLEALFARARELSRELEAFVLRVLRDDVATQLERAASLLEQAGDRVLTPWVLDPEARTVSPPQPDAPFPEGGVLDEAFYGYDVFEQRLHDPYLHNREMLDRVLAWAGEGGVDALIASLRERAARWRDADLDRPLFDEDLDTPWRFSPQLDGGYLEVASVLAARAHIDALTDQDLEAFARQGGYAVERILRAYRGAAPPLWWIDEVADVWGEAALVELAPALAAAQLDAPEVDLGDLGERLREVDPFDEDRVVALLERLGLGGDLAELGFDPGWEEWSEGEDWEDGEGWDEDL